MHIPCFPFNTSPDLLRDKHLQHRGFFQTLDHAQAGPARYPGLPFKMSETPWALRRPAPLLGEHNEEVLCGRLGLSRRDLAELRCRGVV